MLSTTHVLAVYLQCPPPLKMRTSTHQNRFEYRHGSRAHKQCIHISIKNGEVAQLSLSTVRPLLNHRCARINSTNGSTRAHSWYGMSPALRKCRLSQFATRSAAAALTQVALVIHRFACPSKGPLHGAGNATVASVHLPTIRERIALLLTASLTTNTDSSTW